MESISIGDALFTKTQQRVLGLLYGNPGESYYTNEIVRLADIGRGTVTRELKQMVSSGLLQFTQDGNHNYYQANPDNLIYQELVNIFTKISNPLIQTTNIKKTEMDALVKKYRKHILNAAKENGVCNVRVFGSRARNEANKNSDLDLLVDIKKGKSGLALGGFLSDVTELTNRKVDVVTEKSLHPKIRDKVLCEAVGL